MHIHTLSIQFYPYNNLMKKFKQSVADPRPYDPRLIVHAFQIVEIDGRSEYNVICEYFLYFKLYIILVNLNT